MFQVISLKDTENSVCCGGEALHLDKIQYAVIANLLTDILIQKKDKEGATETKKI